MRMRQMKFFIDWTISFEIIWTLFLCTRWCIQALNKKKTPWWGTKSPIRIYSHCNWIDRFDFKLYIFISKHFFDPLLAMILFQDEIFKVIFFNITQDRIRKNIQNFEPNSEDNVFRLIYNRAKNNSWSFLIRHKKNCFELRLHARFENIAEAIWEIILLMILTLESHSF